MGKKKQPKRSVHLKGLDKTLELGKVTEIQFRENSHEFIYLEKMKGEHGGKWRLTYTDKTVPDIELLESIEIVRHEQDELE